MVVNNVITDHILRPVVDTIYWLVPHQLLSNLDRDIAIANVNVNCATGCRGMQPNQADYLAHLLARIPGASGTGDVVYWLAYLFVVCAIPYASLRLKQV
jgi:hypothetical protein